MANDRGMCDHIARSIHTAPSVLTAAAALCFILGLDPLTTLFACLAFIQQFVLRVQVTDLSALDRLFSERKPIPEAPRRRISDRHSTWERFAWNTHVLVAFVMWSRPTA